MAPAAKTYKSMTDAFEEAQEQQMSEYTSQGGKWLAAVRQWMQHNLQNGDRVIWGSNTILNVTARQLEEVAALAVDATFPEMSRLQRENRELEMRLFALTGSSKV